MEELQFGQFAISVIIMVVLGIAYKILGDLLDDRLNVVIAICLGLGLGVLSVPYANLEWSAVNLVNNILSGFMSAAAASGLYTWQNKAR
jgi:hypothetical protein